MVTGVRKGTPFQFTEGKDGVFLCYRFQDSYSQPQCIVKYAHGHLLGYSQWDSFTNPMLITAFVHLKITGSPVMRFSP